MKSITISVIKEQFFAQSGFTPIVFPIFLHVPIQKRKPDFTGHQTQPMQ